MECAQEDQREGRDIHPAEPVSTEQIDIERSLANPLDLGHGLPVSVATEDPGDPSRVMPGQARVPDEGVRSILGQEVLEPVTRSRCLEGEGPWRWVSSEVRLRGALWRFSEHLAQDVLQDSTVAVVFEFVGSVDPDEGLEFGAGSVG